MKILGFVLRLLLVVVLVVWLADKPGTAQIEWHDMIIETSAAVLAVIVGLLIYAFVVLHRLWRYMWDGPRFWKLRRRAQKLEDGHKEIAKGMAALAAGRASDAGHCAIKARKLLGETPATHLLQAQAAQLAGDSRTAKTLYEAMTNDPDTAILGYRGLITAAWKADDMDEVGRLIGRVQQSKANVPWLDVVRLQMGVKLENWAQAEASLEKARRTRALPRAEADEIEAALLLVEAKNALRASDADKALSLSEKARKLAPKWIPAFLVLAEAQIVNKHNRAAMRTIERAWAIEPHPQLVPLVHWALQSSKPLEGYKAIDKLTRDTRTSPVALMALADAALKADLWGEARRALLAMVQRGLATQMTYQTLARLERRELGDEKAASKWLTKAVAAPPDPEWMCSSCGAAHEYWEANCASCGAFNEMAWGVPGQARAGQSKSAPLMIADVWS